MRNILLTSTAAVCLMLAAQVAQAQSDEHGKRHEQKTEHNQQAPAAHETQPMQHRPSQATEHRQRRSTTGQATDEKKNESPSASENKEPKATNTETHSDRERRNRSADEQKANEPKKSNTANESKPNEDKSKAANENNKANTASDRNKTETANDRNKADMDKAKSNTASDRNKTNTATDQNKANENATPKSAEAPKTGTQPKQENASTPNDKTNVTATDKDKNRTDKSVTNISKDKKVKISETISKHHDLAPPVKNVDISITVGQRVPSRIHLHPLPRTIVTIAPEYRDYEYFTTEEDVVIVSPRTHEIVTRIPRDASRARAESDEGSSTTVSSVSGDGGSAPCQIFRRTASGDLKRLDSAEARETTGSGSSDRLAVRVQAPNGQEMPELALPSSKGRIVAETDGSGCRIVIEPGRTGR
jgi:hypothetical protein